jgi:xylulokinase
MLEVMDHYNVERTLWGQPYAFKGTYGMIGAMATSGALTRWFRDKVAMDLVAAEQAGGPNAYSELVKEAENIPAGSEGLVVLPYFSGERTPLNDPRARGTYFGLTLAHTRAHLFKATLEGVAYSIRHNFDVMKGVGATINEVIAVGGGTKNKIWLQAVSDICGVPQRIPDIVTGASYGDAFIAGLGAGVFSSKDDITKWVKYSREVKPDLAKYDTYNKYFQVYLELYKRNKDLMHDLFHLANP